MYRQIIVTGVPTAGKSTFCGELIKEFHLQHFQIDPIIEGFQDVFPELGITHYASTHELHINVCKNFQAFLFRMIKGLEFENFVIEGFRIPFEEMIEKYGKTHQIFVFAYPNATPEERLAACRKHDVDNWTNEYSDEQILEEMKFFIDESKRFEKLCEKYKIPFFDTSFEYWTVIQKAVSLVK